MKVVIVFDSFKGSLTAEEAVTAAREGVLTVVPDANITSLPLADGGEGTAEAICRLMDAEWRTCRVHDPLFRMIDARYGICNDGKTAVMEMAAAAGLTLLTESERNPMKTTTFGVGEMILDAIGNGCTHIIIGIGGSATNDCGIGMLTALGACFLDDKEEPLEPVGENLSRISHIDWKGLTDLNGIKIDVICDVNNPLFGKDGAAFVYAPQKGANDDEVSELDKGLRHFSSLCNRTPKHPSSGAAGGLGYAFLLLGANLKKGADAILDATNIDNVLKDADIVITGEGKIDRQTLNGKLPFSVLKRAKKQNVPVIVFAGQIEDKEMLLQAGFHSVKSINPPNISLQEAMKPKIAGKNLRTASKEYCEILLSAKP